MDTCRRHRLNYKSVLQGVSSVVRLNSRLFGTVPIQGSLVVTRDSFFRKFAALVGIMYSMAVLSIQIYVQLAILYDGWRGIPKALSDILIQNAGYVAGLVAASGARIFYMKRAKYVLQMEKVLHEIHSSTTNSIRLPRLQFGCLLAYMLLKTCLPIIDISTNLIHSGRIKLILYSLLHYSFVATELQNIRLTLLGGLQLLSHYKQTVAELKSKMGQLGQDQGTTDPVEVSPQDKQQRLFDRIESLQAAFNLYRTVSGFVLFLDLLVHGTNGLVFSYHAVEALLIKEWDDFIFWSLWSAENYARILFIGYVGQLLRDEVENGAHELKLALLARKVALGAEEHHLNLWSVRGQSQDESLTREIYEQILSWQWSLRACGIFDVDYTVFSKVGGHFVTAVLFVISLKLAEQSSGSKLLAASSTWES